MGSRLHQRSISRRLRGLILPLLRPQLELCAQFWTSQYKRYGHTGEHPVKGQEGEEGTGASLLSGKAERAGAVQPGEVKAQGDLPNAWRYWKGGCQMDRARLLSVVPLPGPQAVGTNSYTGDSLRTSGNFFTVRVTEYWHSLPKKSSSLEVFQIHLDMVLSFSWPAFSGEVGPDELWRSVPMSSSLWF